MNMIHYIGKTFKHKQNGNYYTFEQFDNGLLYCHNIKNYETMSVCENNIVSDFYLDKNLPQQSYFNIGEVVRSDVFYNHVVYETSNYGCCLLDLNDFKSKRYFSNNQLNEWYINITENCSNINTIIRNTLYSYRSNLIFVGDIVGNCVECELVSMSTDENSIILIDTSFVSANFRQVNYYEWVHNNVNIGETWYYTNILLKQNFEMTIKAFNDKCIIVDVHGTEHTISYKTFTLVAKKR